MRLLLWAVRPLISMPGPIWKQLASGHDLWDIWSLSFDLCRQQSSGYIPPLRTPQNLSNLKVKRSASEHPQKILSLIAPKIWHFGVRCLTRTRAVRGTVQCLQRQLVIDVCRAGCFPSPPLLIVLSSLFGVSQNLRPKPISTARTNLSFGLPPSRARPFVTTAHKPWLVRFPQCVGPLESYPRQRKCVNQAALRIKLRRVDGR